MPSFTTPDEKLNNSTGKTAPSVDEDSVNREPSEYSIRNIPVRNTVPPPEGKSIPKLPTRLPFD